MATFHKASEYFQKKYAESLRVLEKYKLRATIKHTNDEVQIILTSLEGGNSFTLEVQHARCIETAKFTMRAIDTLAGEFFAAFPKLIPMLELRSTYFRIHGGDIDSDSFNSLHKAFHEMEPTDPEFDAEVDGQWMLWDYQNDVFFPFSSKALKGLESMYAGATVCHSAQSMLSAFMTQPSTKIEALTPGSHRYALDGSIWFLSMECDGNGLKLIPAYEGQKPLGTYQWTTECHFDGHVSFVWTGIKEGFLTLSWDAIKEAFNIDRALYDAHVSCSDDPLTVLKACLAQLQLDSGKDLESLAADFKLGNAPRVVQPKLVDSCKISKYNRWFREQYEDELADLATYGLKASVRETDQHAKILLSYGGKPFLMQFCERIELDDVSQESLEEVAANFWDALEALYPMLAARRRYMAWSGKDLDPDSVVSLHNAWNEDGDDEDFDNSWDLTVDHYDVVECFCTLELELLTQMYVAGAATHSKLSALESFLVQPSSPHESEVAGEHSYGLNEVYICMRLRAGPRGLEYDLTAGGTSSSDFEIAGVDENSDLEINLPPIFWKTVNVSWAQLQKRFGISKELFDVHMQMSTGPLEALKSVYHHVNTEPMTQTMAVAAGFDFTDTSEPVGVAFPAESNATDFAIQA
jgi:hypothetical protein